MDITEFKIKSEQTKSIIDAVIEAIRHGDNAPETYISALEAASEIQFTMISKAKERLESETV